MNQLKHEAKAKYVRSFEMRNNKDVVDYYLFYVTNNILGLEKMKEAMWKVDDSGEFSFSDATNPNQMVLFESKPDYSSLTDMICDKFQGDTPTIVQIEEFVLSETPFVKSHYKVNVLKRLENSDPPKIVVENALTGRRKGTYANQKMRIRFL